MKFILQIEEQTLLPDNTNQDTEIVLGDINKDTHIDSNDALMTLKIAL